MANIRICCVCGKPMKEGFCIQDGEAYYCSKDCLHEDFSEQIYRQMVEDGLAYWTQWEDEVLPDPPATLKVCYKRPGEAVQVREISNTISALQNLVGGYIEISRTWHNGVLILCDEEGLIKGKRPNCMGLVGDIAFIGVKGSDFCSLTDDQIQSIEEWEAYMNGE